MSRLAIVVVPLAVVEWLAYALLLHDTTTSWFLYIAYLALGVILPGTLLCQAFVSWRADWLTWMAIGWAVGHGLEAASIQLAKVVGLPRLFLLWIPIAYLLVWWRRQWQGEVVPLSLSRLGALLLAVVIAFASTTFVALNLLELSPQPVYQSDVFFHINEAHEFRDHLDTSDPRIVGRSYAYHTLEYGPAVGANLATQVPLANLITRYSGLSMVWLLVLLLFNSARNLRGSVAGFWAAAIIVAPLDVFSLVSSKLSFGSSIIYSGLDLSTSTLVGFWAIAAVFLPLRWYFLRGRLRDLWVIALLAYMAAGSKSVPGPLLLAASAVVVGGTLVQRRKLSLRSVALAGTLAAVFCLTALPILLRATVADSATIKFASTARLNPFSDQLLRIPGWLRLGFYPIGLSFLLWVGVTFGVWRLVRDGETALSWFVAASLLLGAVIVEAISLPGESELFFLYVAMVLVAPVAGMGLCEFGRLLQRRRGAAAVLVVALALAGVGVHLKVGGTPSPPLYDGSEFITGLHNRIVAGVDAYRDPKPPSPPTMSWSIGGRFLRVTPDIVDGLSWLRGVATSSTVIATNVPGAALYAALCECREYYQTEQYAPEYIRAHDVTGTTITTFDGRARLLTQWMSGKPGSLTALRDVGITFVIVDHVNGVPVSPQGMPRPVFSNAGISIYRT